MTAIQYGVTRHTIFMVRVKAVFVSGILGINIPWCDQQLLKAIKTKHMPIWHG